LAWQLSHPVERNPILRRQEIVKAPPSAVPDLLISPWAIALTVMLSTFMEVLSPFCGEDQPGRQRRVATTSHARLKKN